MEEFRRIAYRLLRHSTDTIFDRRLSPKLRNFNLSSASGFRYCCKRNFETSRPHISHYIRKLQTGVFPQIDCSLSPLNSAIGFQGNTCGDQYRNFSSMSTTPQRDLAFSTVSHDDIIHFKKMLGEKNVVQDEERLLTANTDWMHKYKGSSKLLLLPRSTEEVSQILKYCNSRCLAVVPQGGNTGLVGGSVPVFDEVIINMGAMNKIVSFDKVSGILVCEAGCILDNLITFLDNHGFIMPLDLGAKGSCQIGGNVSTNAGGLRLVRYGSLHGNVLGLEAVLSNGTVLDMLGTLRKDNTGYDLKHLFIGSEGSLGIVTKVSILTPPKLSSVNLAFLACKDYDSCQKLLLEAKRKLGEILSAFEFLDTCAMDLVLKYLDGVRNPLPPSMHNFYVLIETTGSNQIYDKEKLEAFLLHSLESGLISDGVLAQDMNQASSFWHIREGVAEALMKAGVVYKYDLSLPVAKLYDIVEEMRARLGPAANVLGFGHLGDGNLHLNISAPRHDDNILAQIEPFVFEWTSKHYGSISAEHGLGLMKANKIHYSKSRETVELMASVKKLLDPNGILNPYKVPGALPVTAGLAKEAGVLFQSGKFADCVKVLNQLLQKKENDLKVLHNIAIAENFQDGYSDPKRLLEVLNNVKKRNEDHVRASAEQVEPVSNLGSKAITGSKASNSVGNQLFAPNSSPAVYTDDFDSSVATYNIAVTWFYLHEHEKAFSILEPLYQNIEPIDEGTALRICLLLLDVALLSRHASRSADVISYIEKVFCFNGLISQGDNGSSVQQQSSTMMLKSSAVPSNSTIPDTSSNLDSLASANASEIPLTRTLSEETLEYDFLSLDISSQNLPRPSPLQSSNKTQADEYISTNDLRLKLHFYKVRFLLLTRNLKAAKREVKMAMNVAQGKDYSIALFLKSQLEYARGNHRKAIKLLMASSNRSESGILSMYYNNLGCIYFGLGKHHTSSLFFSKALNSGLSLRKEKPLKLTTVLEDKSNLIIYNCGIQYLACGKPLLAFRCFYKAGLVFYNRPLLWLRIAECCLMALEKGLIKSSFCPSKVSDIKASVIGKGKWRQLGIEDGILKNGEDLFLGDEKKQHNLSISLAKQCLNNALHLLNCSDTKYTELGSFSNAKAEEIESKEAVHANGEAKEQKGREQKGGNSVTFSSSLMSSISEYEDIHRRENHMTKQSVLADLAYVELELGNPLKALSMARTLLKLPECSGIFLFLGNVYAAEALCLLNRLVEAAEYLSIYLSSENEIKLPFSQDDYEQWTSLEKAAESEETNGRPLRGNLDDSSRKLGFLSPEEARGTLYANLAATSAIQGDLEQARRFVVQASSLISDSPQAIMTEIYIEIRLGNTKEAVARLKRYNHIRFVPGNLELDGSSSSSL